MRNYFKKNKIRGGKRERERELKMTDRVPTEIKINKCLVFVAHLIYHFYSISVFELQMKPNKHKTDLAESEDEKKSSNMSDMI